MTTTTTCRLSHPHAPRGRQRPDGRRAYRFPAASQRRGGVWGRGSYLLRRRRLDRSLSPCLTCAPRKSMSWLEGGAGLLILVGQKGDHFWGPLPLLRRARGGDRGLVRQDIFIVGNEIDELSRAHSGINNPLLSTCETLSGRASRRPRSSGVIGHRGDCRDTRQARTKITALLVHQFKDLHQSYLLSSIFRRSIEVL
jgi:hypothetical protein